MRFLAPVLLPLLLSTSMLRTQEPLPFLHRQDVILFMGDSITGGGRQRTGLDYNHIMGQEYAYILAAQIGLDSPKRELTFVNFHAFRRQRVSIFLCFNHDKATLSSISTV